MMKTNSITAAPQVADCQAAFGVWQQTQAGEFADFLRFMVTPGRGRDEFIESMNPKVEFYGHIAAITI